jgi:hypothetical protein
MGEEHDSWLEGLGINISPPDTTSSVVSGLGEMVKSGLSAAGDMVRGGMDMAKGEAEGVLAKGEYLGAGVLDAAGAHDTAKDLRNRADANEADSKKQFQAGWKELGKAKDDIFGGETTAQRVPKTGKGPQPTAGKTASGNAMQGDCKVVRGKVPGPANHVLCGTHGHILDLGSKTIIAGSLEEYKKAYGKGGGGYAPNNSKGGGAYGGGGGGGSYGQGTQPPSKPKHGMSSGDDPNYGEYANASGVGMAQRPTGYSGGQDQDYGDQPPQQPTYPEQPESPEYEGGGEGDYGDQPDQREGGYGKGGRGQQMGQDCKPVHGKCPGPANHVLCSTHGHVLDTASGMIIAESVDDYVKIYGGGKGGGGGYAPPSKPPKTGYGGGGGGGYTPPKPPKGNYGGGGGGGGYGGGGVGGYGDQPPEYESNKGSPPREYEQTGTQGGVEKIHDKGYVEGDDD